MTQPLFISFEGIDGSGKSTHIPELAQLLQQQGRNVTLTREPGGTKLAEHLRLTTLQQPMDALTETLLMFAARRDHLRQLIEPALARGEVVLCDRFTDSTFAYQGGGRGLEDTVLRQLEIWVQVNSEGVLRQPDLTVWFALEPALAAERRGQVRLPDRFEAEPVAFFQAVHDGYERRAQADPERFIRLDASLPQHQVWQQLTRSLVERGQLSIMLQGSDGGSLTNLK